MAEGEAGEFKMTPENRRGRIDEIIDSAHSIRFFGKLPEGAVVSMGRTGEITKVGIGEAGQYHMYGESKNPRYSEEGFLILAPVWPKNERGARELVGRVDREFAGGRWNDLANYPIITVFEGTNGNSQVAIRLLQDALADKYQRFGVGATIYIELPTARAAELVGMLNQNPDDLEDLMESALPGINNEQTGMRAKSLPRKGFFLVTDRDIGELERATTGEGIREGLKKLGRKEYKNH
ncbi:hypothetical protein A2382_03570 [Candidatus Woesebacteria bacterium RIFOXYB1_FULL_38_16]|uniref:Uncharacterized protein n=1 Tax=Candidatus Woesebacteria bacterium RIFOXYB1_FULL_38_16 TaxID=1802538 RepID=A0A1F8CTP0_9BACT|nr:MAG: hypothetical protein A2191_01665 [Candidatus Woesebacteria bacterium RIFOXYA1_FULL_38_9]OGM78945.1 MAG: hypothetical protein A2382_03570 [Candidatus Woesebacteria bacterium RIFOXYB1_FULL_38_16]